MPVENPVLPGNVTGPHPKRLPSLHSPWNQPVPPEYQMDNRNLDKLTKRIALLAAAEESYRQAASVLQPAIKAVLNYANIEEKERLQTGLHLLQEAMNKHNQYMDILK